jgi:ABC-type transport system involved in multi-copper enzyme maturation permease subunit
MRPPILTRSLGRSEVLLGKVWALFTYLAFAMTIYFGVFLSVATRQSVAAVGGTVIYAMALQGVAVIHAISGVDPYLLTNQLTAWHALFETPFHIGPILRAIWVSIVFALPPLIAALVIFNRRDVAD